MAAEESLRGKIDCNQFVEVYKDLATRPEVYFLMVRYANKDYLSCQDLTLFLETEQGVRDSKGAWLRLAQICAFQISGVSEVYCGNIIEQCEPCPEVK